MGNKIYSICGIDGTQENEIKSVSDIVSPNVQSRRPGGEERMVRGSPMTNSPYKLITELNEEEKSQLREFDENILNHGRWVSPAEMATHVNEKVVKVERMIGAYVIPQEETEKFQGAFESGPFLFNDGTVYCGQWSLTGKKQGYGIYIKPDGSKYEGLWNNDKIEGVGRYIDKNGNYYEGSWKNGMANGKGSLVVTQGSKYTGNWVNDFQEGYGEETFQDGTSYKGDYKNGHKEGQGEFTWSDGSVYRGDFSNSSIQGTGTLKWKDQRQYSGQWVHNKMHGFGTFIWPDGKKYVGEYKNDKKEGEGAYYWSDEKYYKGQWLNSKQHGEGMLVLKDKTLRGQFRFGKLVKKYEDSNKENNQMMNGKMSESPSNVYPVTSPEKVANVAVDDKQHHMENIHIGSTKSVKIN